MAAPHLCLDRPGIADEKRAARRTARLRLAGVDVAAESVRVAARLSLHPDVRSARRVAAFWPLPDEPDLREFLGRLEADGTAILLPCVVGADLPLVFERWRAGGEGTPDLILVPMLAFDRSCRRLGRGGGHYDRTLARHAGTTAIGIAFAASETERVPIGPHDRRLDAVVTERDTHVADQMEG